MQGKLVTLNDDPFGFSKSEFTYLGFVDKFMPHIFDLTHFIGVPVTFGFDVVDNKLPS